LYHSGEEEVQMEHRIFFITGASGAGKTATVSAVEKMALPNVEFCYFDRIGVPSPEEMIKEYGSGERWQQAKTLEWVQLIKQKYLAAKDVVLDGQARMSFIASACAAEGLKDYEIVLFDCSDQERTRRLAERGQPELANEDMLNWARYLRNEAVSGGYQMIDTTNLAIKEAVNALLACLRSAPAPGSQT
jgi:hypothetical protein